MNKILIMNPPFTFQVVNCWQWEGSAPLSSREFQNVNHRKNKQADGLNMYSCQTNSREICQIRNKVCCKSLSFTPFFGMHSHMGPSYSPVSSDDPLQSFPPFFGSGSVQVRVRVLVPPLQVTLQCPHWDHAVHFAIYGNDCNKQERHRSIYTSKALTVLVLTLSPSLSPSLFIYTYLSICLHAYPLFKSRCARTSALGCNGR